MNLNVKFENPELISALDTGYQIEILLCFNFNCYILQLHIQLKSGVSILKRKFDRNRVVRDKKDLKIRNFKLVSRHTNHQLIQK